ncbi:MAG: hypothetical protein SH856_13420 [Flavobacteriales bacterium]|nr:hypothetical protein [Flavobacteriales bacterium]
MKTIYSLFTLLVCSCSAFASMATIEVKAPDHGASDANVLPCNNYTLTMYDSFGDGWNGAIITISNAWNSAVFTGTLANGSVSTQTICLFDGCYTIAVTGGSFSSEVSWQISQGIFLYADGGAPTNTSVGFGFLVDGCLDVGACNYNSNANCSDASACCYEDCIFIQMADAEGDGWGGTHLRIYDNLDVLVADLTMPSGYYSSWSGCLPHDGCYTIAVGNGGGGNGSWELYYATTVGEGFVSVMEQPIYGVQYYFSTDGECTKGCAHPLACDYSPYVQWQEGYCCFQNCATIQMLQSFYGQGWDGAEFVLTNWHNEEVARGSLLSNHSIGIQKLCLPDGCYTLSVSAPDMFNPLTWHYTDSTGNDIIGGPNSNTPIQVGTLIEGCLNSTAANYNPNANCGSGLCLYTCESDLDGNGVVNVGDLLIFTSDFGDTCY